MGRGRRWSRGRARGRGRISIGIAWCRCGCGSRGTETIRIRCEHGDARCSVLAGGGRRKKYLFMRSDHSRARPRGARWRPPVMSSPPRADQVALARLLPVSSLLYSPSETLISSSSAISPKSNTTSLSVPSYRITSVCAQAMHERTLPRDRL